MSLESVAIEVPKQIDLETVSAIGYSLPLGGHGVLVIHRDGPVEPRTIWERFHGTVEGDLLWLQRSDLWQLAVPNPIAVHTFPLPYYIREEGKVLYGEDLRAHVPCLRRPASLLRAHIAASLLWVRGPFILSCLLDGREGRLRAGLKRERLLLMQTALLAKRIWKVSPDTISEIFREAYPQTQIRSLLDELESRQGGTTIESDSIETVWLHERLIQKLSACAA